METDLAAGRARSALVCPVLVGRDDLLELGDRRLDQVVGGPGHLLFLAGEAGIGKTRLLNAIVRAAQGRGFVFAGGDVGPRDLEVPGGLIYDLTRSMVRHPRLRATGEAIRERLLRTASRGEGRGTPAQARRWLIGDVADLLAEVPSPAMLAMENLHWADDLSLEVLGAFAARLSDLQVLVVGTYRSDELYPRIPMREWRARLVTQRLAEEVRLQRLSSVDTGTMTTLLTQTGLPASRDVVDAIHARTDGIPLHVEELLGVLRDPDGRVVVEMDHVSVPDTIESTVRERLDGRSPEARALAEAGSVIGRCFVVDVAAGVLDRSVEQVAGPLQELIDHFFIIETGRPGLYDFRHALIRDAIYGSVAEPRRRTMHGRAAELGEGLPGAGEAFASAHFELAGRPGEAFQAALAAARASTDLNAHREAAQLYRRALRTVPADLDPVVHAEVLRAYGQVAAAIDDNAAAAAALEEAHGRFLAAGRPLEAAGVVAPLVAVRHLLGDGLAVRVERLQAALDGLAALPPGPGVDATRLRLLAGLSAAYMLDRRLDASIEHGRAAQSLAARIRDRAQELNALTTVGSDLLFAGRMEEGWAALDAAIEAGTEASSEPGIEEEVARAYRMAGSSGSVLVEYDRAERSLLPGIAFAERTELWNHRHYMAAHLAHVRWATGHWSDAESIALRSLADGRGGVTTRITALHVLGYLALGRGLLGPARDHLEEARQLGQAMAELQRISPAIWGLAELALAEGDPGSAIRHCRDGLALSAAVDDVAYLFPFLVTGTRAWIAAGDVSGATAWADDVTARLRARSIPGTLPAIDHASGLVRLGTGSLGRAQTALDAAVAGWRARRREPDRIAAVLDAAGCHLRAGRPARAVQEAREAMAAAEALGSRPLADRARSVFESARARHPEDEPWAPLTVREFEVARLVAEGHTNAAIGQELGIATRTVGAHVEHILAKLGIGRRVEIAAWTAARPVLHSRPHGADREE